MNLEYLKFAKIVLEGGLTIKPYELQDCDADIVHHKNFSTLSSYSMVFLALYGRKINSVFEIGVASGGSMILWNLVFECKVVGIDIVDIMSDMTKEYMKSHSMVAHFMSSMNVPDVEHCIEEEFPDGIDIIIDDGAHTINEMKCSVEHLFKYVNVGGLYFIEDWQALHPIHQKELYDYLYSCGHNGDISTYYNFIVLRK